MKHGDNATRSRRLVSIFKDGQLATLRTDMLETPSATDIVIFRFLHRATIINCISKTKYTEWVESRLKEEDEDTIN